MPHTGTLRTWHDDRGFGFIAPSDGGRELFVHISAFPRDGLRPTVGESLSFEVGPGKDGKQQAIRIQRRAVRPPSPHPRRPEVRSKQSRLVALVAALVVALGAFGYYKYQESQPPEQQSTPTVADTKSEPLNMPAPANTKRERQSASRVKAEAPTSAAVEATPEVQVSMPYRCDGRTRCSQMTSCEEARFFLANCPGVQMDGDNDGIPCEQQWCPGR